MHQLLSPIPIPNIQRHLFSSPSNVAGKTKQSVISAMILIAYCVGNVAGAQVFKQRMLRDMFRAPWLARFVLLLKELSSYFGDYGACGRTGVEIVLRQKVVSRYEAVS